MQTQDLELRFAEQIPDKIQAMLQAAVPQTLNSALPGITVTSASITPYRAPLQLRHKRAEEGNCYRVKCTCKSAEEELLIGQCADSEWIFVKVPPSCKRKKR